MSQKRNAFETKGYVKFAATQKNPQREVTACLKPRPFVSVNARYFSTS